jgi:hypothetical protein
VVEIDENIGRPDFSGSLQQCGQHLKRLTLQAELRPRLRNSPVRTSSAKTSKCSTYGICEEVAIRRRAIEEAYHNLSDTVGRSSCSFVINRLDVERTLGTDGGGMDCWIRVSCT